MRLKAYYDKKEDIPEGNEDLYVERDGRWELAVEIPGVEGVKSYSDFTRIYGSLQKERNDHRSLKQSLSVLGDRRLEDVVADLDRIPELEALAKGKVGDKDIDQLLEGRLKTRLAPVERELNSVRAALQEREQRLQQYEIERNTMKIHDAIRRAAAESGVLPEAVEDALLWGERLFEVDANGKVVIRDNVGHTPGMEPSAWFTEMQSRRPHWWGPSFGGGATGNRGSKGFSGNNPWSGDGWNMTEQARILREDRRKAEQLAKAAGTTIGGPRPKPKASK